jgi:E3 ubiquitin-protein ligase EDD1
LKAVKLHHPTKQNKNRRIKFFLAGGVPKVGQLLNSAWSLTDTCRFKILQPPKKPKLPELPKASKDKQKEDNDSASMPPPPSPASSTCSDGSLSSPGN